MALSTPTNLNLYYQSNNRKDDTGSGGSSSSNSGTSSSSTSINISVDSGGSTSIGSGGGGSSSSSSDVSSSDLAKNYMPLILIDGGKIYNRRSIKRHSLKWKFEYSNSDSDSEYSPINGVLTLDTKTLPDDLVLSGGIIRPRFSIDLNDIDNTTNILTDSIFVVSGNKGVIETVGKDTCIEFKIYGENETEVWLDFESEIKKSDIEKINNSNYIISNVKVNRLSSKILDLSNLKLEVTCTDKTKIQNISCDLYIHVHLFYYSICDNIISGDSDKNSLSGYFFDTEDEVYYIEGNYIKKFVVSEFTLNCEYDDSGKEIILQSSIIDTHRREHADSQLFVDKENVMDYVINNQYRKTPKLKNFYIKCKLGDYVYSLLDGCIRNVKISKITYNKKESLVDYSEKISIKYTLQEINDGIVVTEWEVDEDNVFENKSDITNVMIDEISGEESANNLVYVGCDICEVK